MRREDYDVWYDKFKPISDEDGQPISYETYGEDLEKIQNTDEEFIWTVLDCDGKLYLSPGFHYVNRFLYFICAVAWKEGQREYKY